MSGGVHDMTVTIDEIPGESQESGANGYVEREYLGQGSDDAADIAAEAVSAIPSTVNGFGRQPLRYRHLGAEIWMVSARWATGTEQPPPPIQQTDGWVYEYDTGETSIHRTHSIDTVDSGACTGFATVPDQGNAVNVSTDGVAGFDIPVSDGRLMRRRIMDKDDVSASWLRSMQQLAFSTNDGTWEGWSAGEALYRKTRYSDRLDGTVEIVQEFSVGANVSSTFYGATGIAKNAHEYLWVLTETIEDPTAKTLVSTPRAVYVERVFPELDFDALEPV